jgi:hypothetical protein
MRRLFQIQLASAATVLLLALACSRNFTPSVAHGPTMPPPPWEEIRVAHGPTMPPPPWEEIRVAHGPTMPPPPWEEVRVTA